MRKNPLWFWLCLLLICVSIFLFFRKQESTQKISKIQSEQISDSTHLSYFKLIEAINLRDNGEDKLAVEILKDLSKSSNLDIKKAAIFLLSKPKTENKVQFAETPPKQQIIEIGEVEVPQPQKNLQKLEFTTENVEKLRGSENFLNLTSSKGKKFEYLGDIENLQANGYGIGIYESGSIYKGSWKNNLRNGKGIFTWKDGERYDGYYYADLRQGEGTYIWKNGEKYVGEWKEDRRHGKGIIYKKNGKVKSSGLWENDNLIKSIKNLEELQLYNF